MLALLAMLPGSLTAWPASVYSKIFQNALHPLPKSLGLLLKEYESVLMEPCQKQTVESASQTAIEQLTRTDRNPRLAVLTDAGCAVVVLNDPKLIRWLRQTRKNFPLCFTATMNGFWLRLLGFLKVRT